MAKRGMMSASPAPATRRLPKEEGSIADIFTSLTDEEHNALPERFSDLKKEMWKDSLVESWREVLKELETTVEEVATRGSDMVPRISYSDIQKGLSKDQINEIKKTGTIVITGAIPQDEALAWKQSIRDYALANADRVKGFPPENIQVFELYNTKAQTLARTHPGLINTHKFLLSLWHTSDPNTPISLRTPISYYDRLRIRQPGDAKFTLGPHIDGGALERWEDPGFRGVFGKILEGGSNWRKHDPYDASKRIGVIQDLYNASNQCSIFRPWQGWTSLSSTGPGEGTLKVLPMLNLASAYIILRPFFRPTAGSSLAFNDWKLDLESTAFPGSSPRKTQELNERTHPHLCLGRTMASIPRVEPGDQVYWHCDGVHAVEGHHGGKGDSSVLYIPAVPLTQHNAAYLRDQRDNFLVGLPAPDFPGGEGESKFVGRATLDDIKTPEGRKMLGFVPFDPATDGPNRAFVVEVNRTLGL
ncbi:hypothetical protein BDQ12DRAFT_695360 [Crucibulum laeve]|uniref:DUF1479-domain-containing protein n=1 Tax=Crucibulum laeve TaxID=68775 RepID=A0A5C3MI84_9AGAR|nr:hypothetical protein BDQ12DRAFT_695360 [Crucibulum laeve]